MNSSIKQEIFTALQSQVPANAAQYCWDLWHEDPFHFIITKSRNSKLGDFRYHRDRAVQTITINHDLNPYQFLITYIHEVAHYRVFKQFGPGHRPHGPEWKKTFRELMSPMLSDIVFPKDILLPLKRHLTNPKASSGADFWLTKELRKYDTKYDNGQALFLGELKSGAEFELRGRIFQKIATRRTRVLCLEVKTGKNFLISGHAEITPHSS